MILTEGGTEIPETMLIGANLTGTDLRGASLMHTEFDRAILDRVKTDQDL